MTHENEFIMSPERGKPSDGFVPDVIEAIGYGTETAIDTETKRPGLIPVPVQIIVGEVGRERTVDNPGCYAKILKFDGDSKFNYYIRMNARGDLSDPWGLYTDGAQNMNIAKHKGTPQWEFKRVPERAFLTYLRYLVGRNNAILRICERDIKDA